MAAAFPEFVDPNPSVDNGFGTQVVPLSTGNVVVTSPFDDAGGVDAGAVYLFNGATGELISTLTGSQGDDRVGEMRSSESSITALTNGNFLISSPSWDNGGAVNTGAVTFGNGVTGVSGQVSELNSLIGAAEFEGLGGFFDVAMAGVYPLPSGDYVVINGRTANGDILNAGSVTHGDGEIGTTGVIDASNSLVGTRRDDRVGDGGISVLPNGNYIILSERWNSDSETFVGAMTTANGDSGVVGELSETNSLIGDRQSVFLAASVVPLTNGSWAVAQPFWRNDAGDLVGAVTRYDGTDAVVGVFDPENSLVGASDGDEIGRRGTVTALSNGNYVVASRLWDNGSVVNAGAVTWRSGTDLTGEVVSEANSFVGTETDQVVSSVWALPNGNYVITGNGPDASEDVDTVATTFANGLTGLTGTVDPSRSLIFSHPSNLPDGFAQILALPNGNYVVLNFADPNEPGLGVAALTLADGSSGISGAVTVSNSLVGGSLDRFPPPIVLSNSNYVIGYANNTSLFGSGTVPPTGSFSYDDTIPSGDVYDLPSGNFADPAGIYVRL